MKCRQWLERRTTVLRRSQVCLPAIALQLLRQRRGQGDPSRTLEADYLRVGGRCNRAGDQRQRGHGVGPQRLGGGRRNAHGVPGCSATDRAADPQRLHVSSGDQLTRHVYNPAGQLVYTRFAANAAIGNIVTQTIGVQLGLQERFEWKAVRAAALNSAVSSRLNDYPNCPQKVEVSWRTSRGKC